MEVDGLNTRRVNPKDNRITLVSLAPAGEAALQKMERLGDEFTAQLLAGFSQEERAQLVAMLKHLQHNLSKQRP